MGAVSARALAEQRQHRDREIVEVLAEVLAVRNEHRDVLGLHALEPGELLEEQLALQAPREGGDASKPA